LGEAVILGHGVTDRARLAVLTDRGGDDVGFGGGPAEVQHGLGLVCDRIAPPHPAITEAAQQLRLTLDEIHRGLRRDARPGELAE
jgi:hypothetical protein